MFFIAFFFTTQVSCPVSKLTPNISGVSVPRILVKNIQGEAYLLKIKVGQVNKGEDYKYQFSDLDWIESNEREKKRKKKKEESKKVKKKGRTHHKHTKLLCTLRI